jgi:hypothetical protein
MQKAAAGVMTTAQQAEHTALRRGAATGRVPGIVRVLAVPTGDPWYSLPNLGNSPAGRAHAPGAMTSAGVAPM